MLNSQDRIFGFDLIKTIAIFMIVFYHMGGIDFGTMELGILYIPNFNKILLSFCAASVPLFLMVHGALILPKHLNLKESILKAIKMFLLFLFGKVILQYVILEKCFCIDEDMAHFWFLGTLGMVYLVSYMMNQSKCLCYIILFLLVLYPFLSNFIYDLIVFVRPDSKFKAIGHDGFFTLYALVYYYLGYYLRDKTISKFYVLLAIIVGLSFVNFEDFVMSNHFQIMFDNVNGSFPTFGALILSSGFFCLFKDLLINQKYIQKAIIFIGSNTLYIYLFHVLFILLLWKYSEFDSSGISLFLSILFSCFLIFILVLFTILLKGVFKSFIKNVSPENY
jgi:surface polysaccharide O-acyltransferase-like enzyme